GRYTPDVDPRAGDRPVAPRRLPRAVGRGDLDLPPRRVDPPPLRPADRMDGRWDSVRPAGGRPALQGEARAPGEEPVRSRGCAPAARRRTAALACTRAGARAPGPRLARRARRGGGEVTDIRIDERR